MKKPTTAKNAITQPGAASTVFTPGKKLSKRDNIFSQSRDTREDRGTRQMKTSHKSQSFPHVR